MLNSKTATRELVVAAGIRLNLGLNEDEIDLLVRVLEPLLGQDVFVAGEAEIMAVAIPDDRHRLAAGDEIGDTRYLGAALQTNLASRPMRTDKNRRRELQDAIALIFRAINA